VDARGNEIVRDEAGDALIRVDLGIQPSASPSHRGGAEVEQHRLSLRTCVFQHLIDIVAPVDLHVSSAAEHEHRAGTQPRHRRERLAANERRLAFPAGAMAMRWRWW
jgi:hypothetical protein